MSDRFSNISTWESGARNWPSSEQQDLICCRVEAETHDVVTFSFVTEDGRPVRFEPGQFLTVSASVNGQTLERCYTISSPPTRPFVVSITVKRVPDGVFSNWIHDTIRPGKALRAYGPSGSFTSTASSAPKLLYLSAGSGITPLMSMSRASFDLGSEIDIAFVHSARTPADIVFRDELLRLSQLLPKFKIFFVCEGVDDAGSWEGGIGRLSLEMLSDRVPDYKDREAFTCGPAPYMHSVREILRVGSHDPTKYHQESFDITAGVALDPTLLPEANAPKNTFTVKLAKSGKTFDMDASDTVLSALKKAGVAIASSCSQGVCGTCKSRLLEGSVDMNHNGGIREREIQKGLRLLCCSRPTSNLVLDL
ncbi:2Fe-2S iron-sulfur cluster-binding protein [Caballeronia sp. DA-9]|uniref:2Fe-2S iron-sulfur cluster-binding protein n=1 Tax=Caballeronia sp. DA-9 TaxID=3436237 RepID=UPI003F66D72B